MNTREIITTKTARLNKIAQDALNAKLSKLEDKYENNVRRVLTEQFRSADTPVTNKPVQELLNEDLTDSYAYVLATQRAKLLDAKLEDVKSQPTQKDDYATKLMKYLPVEVISFYVALTSIVNASTNYQMGYTIGILVAGVIGTWLYLKSVWKVNKVSQIVLSCIAFLAWAISLDKVLNIDSTFQALLLPIVTFVLPLIDPE